MFLTNKAAQEKISTLESRIEELESDLEAKDQEILNLQNEQKNESENKANIETLTNELEAKTNEITELNAKLIEAENKAKQAEESTSEKAVEMLATIGQTEAIDIENGAGEQKNILEQFESLKGSEATAFYKEHSKEIRAELKKRNK